MNHKTTIISIAIIIVILVVAFLLINFGDSSIKNSNQVSGGADNNINASENRLVEDIKKDISKANSDLGREEEVLRQLKSFAGFNGGSSSDSSFSSFNSTSFQNQFSSGSNNNNVSIEEIRNQQAIVNNIESDIRQLEHELNVAEGGSFWQWDPSPENQTSDDFTQSQYGSMLNCNEASGTPCLIQGSNSEF